MEPYSNGILFKRAKENNQISLELIYPKELASSNYNTVIGELNFKKSFRFTNVNLL